MSGATQLDGLLVVDKPAGWTSHDVVAKLRGACGQRRIGHAGTLDPDATGVLLVGLGRVTRLLRFLQGESKAYRADVVFGIATDTLDASGRELERRAMPVGREDVEHAAARFVGDVEQVPPMVSAVKVGGRRLHELARHGKDVDRPPRTVHISRLVVEDLVPGDHPVATIRIECGSGTYIRTLADDLGRALGGFAHVRSLRRLRAGAFTLDDAHPLDAVLADPSAHGLTPADAMRAMARVEVDDVHRAAIAHGAVFTDDPIGERAHGAGPFAMVDPGGALLAVYERRGPKLKPAVVLAAAGTDGP
ncbi:MAG TPA: tRNA pseudouridine(55) synthase TruB [Acidimicrobiia bacterium]|nr:tRNA pseudouridine(55) synthase TruB [Acidimicrobiia bacterium]